MRDARDLIVYVPLGTSLVNNYLKRVGREDDNRFLKEISAEVKLDEERSERLRGIISEVRDLLMSGRLQKEELMELSAELNSLFRYYDEIGWPSPSSSYGIVLLATDTALNREIAEVYRDYFREVLGFRNVYVLVVEGLTTRSSSEFSEAMKRFFPSLMSRIAREREEGFRIAFNLTAGFKPFQAYMMILGMILADEMFYIFERGGELLRMPRLPLEIRADLQRHGWKLALLVDGSEYRSLPGHYFKDLPDMYYHLDDEGYITPSDLAVKLWSSYREEMYESDALISLPLLRYSEGFRRGFLKLKPRARRAVSRKLVKLSAIALDVHHSGGKLIDELASEREVIREGDVLTVKVTRKLFMEATVDEDEHVIHLREILKA